MFVGSVVAKDGSEVDITVRTLVYVMKHGGDLLSREVLGQLGVLPPDFPKVGQFMSKPRVDVVSVDGDEDKAPDKKEMFQPLGQCDPQSQLPCQCPLRTVVDVPDQLPVAAVPENRKQLEDWILKTFSSSSFTSSPPAWWISYIYENTHGRFLPQSSLETLLRKTQY